MHTCYLYLATMTGLFIFIFYFIKTHDSELQGQEAGCACLNVVTKLP